MVGSGKIFNNRNGYQKLKSQKGKSNSSSNWIKRQVKDPFVKAAIASGYRSRAAFKLIEIDDKFSILHPKKRILELGCAPGGWTQVIVERVNPKQHEQIIAIDLLPVNPINGATIIKGDFNIVVSNLFYKGDYINNIDLILSDMACPSSGHNDVDHLRIMDLCEQTILIARKILTIGGNFVVKILTGGEEKIFVESLKENFQKVHFFKPKSSRKDSAEIYIVALGFVSK